ncbi:MAG TPA: AAA family ATPase [Acidimicrobiia bacterium]|nr:AAA family ATPase [Acidimicrobiia bacterium]
MTSQGDFETFEAGPGLLESLWRFRRLVVITVVVAAVAGYGLSMLLPTQYEAEAELILTDPSSTSAFQDVTAGRDLSRYVRNEATYMASSEVLGRAAATLGMSIEDLRENVTAVAANDVDLITITARRPTAQGAMAMANAVATSYQELKEESVRTLAEDAISELEATRATLQAEIDTYETRLADDPDNSALKAQRDAAIGQLVTIESRISQIDINSALFGSGVANYEAAELPEAPASPKPLRNAAALAILGLLAAGAYAWWRTENSPLAETRLDAAAVLGAPLLGEVPVFETMDANSEFPAVSAPHSLAAERYHFIVSSLDFAVEEKDASTVVITSPATGDGKTVTAVNLAAAVSADGRRVMVVDADERQRRLTRLAGQNAGMGLVDLARSDVDLEHCLIDWRFEDNLRVQLLPAGTDAAGSAAFFRSPEFKKAMARIKDAAELVLIDSPPALAVSETADIAAEADGVIVVVVQGTSLADLADVRARLEITHTPILGYVFNRSTPPRFGYSRYSGYYGYGYGDKNGRHSR